MYLRLRFYFRSWVEQYTIKNDGSIVVESPNGGIDGFQQTVPDKDIFKSFFVPKMCNHCAKSPCTQVCPVGATFETAEGIVLVDEKILHRLPVLRAGMSLWVPLYSP